MRNYRAMLSEESKNAIDVIVKKGNFSNRDQAIAYLLHIVEIPEYPDFCVICGQWTIHHTEQADPICQKQTCEDKFGMQEVT